MTNFHFHDEIVFNKINHQQRFLDEFIKLKEINKDESYIN